MRVALVCDWFLPRMGGIELHLRDLAIAYAGTGNGVRARRYARSAYALAPMNPYVINAYAVSLEEVGDGRGVRQLAAKARAVAGAPGAS